MKTIKYLRIFLLITVLGIGLSSCGEDEYHTRLHELILNDLTGEKGFDKEGVYIPTEKTAYEKVTSGGNYFGLHIDEVNK